MFMRLPVKLIVPSITCVKTLANAAPASLATVASAGLPSPDLSTMHATTLVLSASRSSLVLASADSQISLVRGALRCSTSRRWRRSVSEWLK